MSEKEAQTASISYSDLPPYDPLLCPCDPCIVSPCNSTNIRMVPMLRTWAEPSHICPLVPRRCCLSFAIKWGPLQATKQKYMRKLERVFHEVDTSGDGLISEDEFKSMMEDICMKSPFVCMVPTTYGDLSRIQMSRGFLPAWRWISVPLGHRRLSLYSRMQQDAR